MFMTKKKVERIIDDVIKDHRQWFHGSDQWLMSLPTEIDSPMPFRKNIKHVVTDILNFLGVKYGYTKVETKEWMLKEPRKGGDPRLKL
jgi:hypothetical protein